MLNQAQGDRAILAKQLNISPQQMKYVTHTEAGEGLIFYGNVVLPFVDHFPKDTELYRIMTTKPEEIQKVLQERILQKPRDGHTTDESRPMWKIGG